MAKFTFIVLAALSTSMVSGYRDQLKATITNCKGGVEVTEGGAANTKLVVDESEVGFAVAHLFLPIKTEIDEFVTPLIPQTDEEKCLMACVFKAYNIINEGHYDPNLAYIILSDVLKDEPEKLKRIKEVIDHCDDDVPKHMDNDCELASEIMQCEVKYQKAKGMA